MKPLINFLEALATSAVILVVVTDPWWTQSTIGLFTLGAVLTVVIFGAFLYGLSEGITIGRNHVDDAVRRLYTQEAQARHRQRSAKMAEKV